MFARLVAIICITLGLLPKDVDAKIITVTYRGGVSGYDLTGVFGQTNTALDGTYTAVYKFDPSHAGLFLSSPTENLAAGGTYWNAVSPVISARLTINGQTFSFSGAYQSQLYGYRSGTRGVQLHYVRDDVTDGSLVTSNEMRNQLDEFRGGGLTPWIDRPFTYDADAHDVFRVGLFEISTWNSATNSYSARAYGRLNPGLLIYAIGVPEPGTWAFMIVGMGITGVTMRRRSHAKV